MLLGFVSPNGKFFECDYYGHLSLADKLLEDVYRQKSNVPVDMLCKFGWVVVQGSFIGFTINFSNYNFHTQQLTAEQRQWLELNKDKMSREQLTSLQICLEIDDLNKL